MLVYLIYLDDKLIGIVDGLLYGTIERVWQDIFKYLGKEKTINIRVKEVETYLDVLDLLKDQI